MRCQHAQTELLEITNPWALSAAEKQALTHQIAANNFCLYQFKTTQANVRANVHTNVRESLAAFAIQLGLSSIVGNECADNDNITRIRQQPDHDNPYIPYSRRALNWHTDGYYNASGDTVRAFLLHCEHAAADGGSNAFMDPEIAYILLRDANAEWADALSHATAMAIPANKQNAAMIRERHCGPVFTTDTSTQCLYTRYTARSRHVEWRDTAATRQACEYFLNMLNQDSQPENSLPENSQWVVKHRLEPGQGIVCNNILHKREVFKDDAATPARLLYRARYRNRIQVA